jgi:hypothetical protein
LNPLLQRFRERCRGWFASAKFREQLLLAVLALAAFELVLDVRILWPTYIDWIFTFDSDTSQYYLGLAFFRFSHWHFPLDHMETMLHPVGASFMLTDAIPLVGLPMKLVSGLLPDDFQPLGLWLLSCVWLNGVFAYRLLSRLVASPALRWAGSVLVMLAPPLVGRFGHCGLSAHWLLLACFETVLLDRLATRRIWFLAAISLFIHSYLFAMVNVLLVGAVFRHRRERRQVLVTLAGWAVAIGLSLWSLGYFGLRATQGGNADHYYGDLFSLINSTGVSSIVPKTELGGRLGRMRPGTPEGFAYLGLGGILLLVALLAAVAARVVARVRPRLAVRPLAAGSGVIGVLCLFWFVYAVSPSPFVFGERYTGFAALTEAIRPVTTRLRAPGRFMWPIFYYVLIFGTQAAERWLDRLQRARAGVTAAAVIVLAQALDVGAWFQQTGQDRAFSHPRPVLDVPPRVSAHVSSRTRIMVFDPPVQRITCPRDDRRWERDFYSLAVFAARHHLTVNTDFRASARLASEDREAVCSYTRRVVDAKKPPPNVIVVTERDARPAGGR